MIVLIFFMAINFNQYLNPNYQEFHQYTGDEVLLWGGANAGKSYSIADKLLLQSIIQKDKKLKTLVIRKTFPSLRNTALDILTKRAEILGLPFNLNKSEWTAMCLNHKFIFLSLNNKEDYDKLKSMTDVDFIWINELLELREDDYEECLRRLRGGESDFEQIIADFNPVDEYSWVNVRFFQKNINNVKKMHYTVYDNHPNYLKTARAQREIARLKRPKSYEPNLYKIYFEGKWGQLKGMIFNWDVVPLPTNDLSWYDEIGYGGDFGFSVDPAALIKIYRKANEYWLQELIYKIGLTNIKLGNQMISMGFVKTDVTVWDSAEPKSIQELCDLGLTALPSIKGKDSVKAIIDFLKEQVIHIVEGSENLIKERKGYVWKKDKNGKSLNVPIDVNDHAIKASGYGIYTLAHTPQANYTYRAYSRKDLEKFEKEQEESRV
jgi:phage terminase large subunit